MFSEVFAEPASPVSARVFAEALGDEYPELAEMAATVDSMRRRILVVAQR